MIVYWCTGSFLCKYNTSNINNALISKQAYKYTGKINVQDGIESRYICVYAIITIRYIWDLVSVAPELEVRGKYLYVTDKDTMKCYVDKGATLNLTCGVVAASPMASAVWSGRGTITFKVPHCLKTLIEIILSKEHKNTFIVLNT